MPNNDNTVLYPQKAGKRVDMSLHNTIFKKIFYNTIMLNDKIDWFQRNDEQLLKVTVSTSTFFYLWGLN